MQKQDPYGAFLQDLFENFAFVEVALPTFAYYLQYDLGYENLKNHVETKIEGNVEKTGEIKI